MICDQFLLQGAGDALWRQDSEKGIDTYTHIVV